MSMNNLVLNKCVVKYLRFAGQGVVATRCGHFMRGKPPGIARSLAQRMKEENAQDHELNARIDIGFPMPKMSRSMQLQQRLQYARNQRSNKELENAARTQNLFIDLEDTRHEYQRSNGQQHIRVIADHYGIYEHLFGYAYFIPRVVLDINYVVADDALCPVYNGNVIKPAEAAIEPEVRFDGETDPITGKRNDGDSFWSLIATNPDAHITPSDSECIHWFVANIPNGKVKEGDALVDYLQPFPPKGLGYQRFVFVLYKQGGKLDLSEYRVAKEDLYNVERRTFKTLDFYRKHQDNLTPAGLAFFQTDWDPTLTAFYHGKLNCKEPIFEYDFPAPYIADQKHFPLRQAFNLYMDRHRDIKQVNKEYLERKLKKTHPFERPAPPLRYPNAKRLGYMPSWLKTEIVKDRLGIGRINDY